MVNTWLVKGRGNYQTKRVISSKYFIENNCVSGGWGDPATNYSESVNDFYSYRDKWNEMYKYKKNWKNQGIYHLFETVKIGDFLWTRLEGVYYVAEVKANPLDLFYIDDSPEAIMYDCVVQLKDIEWKKCGTEESVPGSISTFSRNRNSIFKVDTKETVEDGYSLTSLFSKKVLYPNTKALFTDKNMILYLIGYSGLEDIVALWLYDKYNYVTIPSTNKTSTEKYEFVLVDGSKNNNDYVDTKKIYIQTKNGKNTLNFKDYEDLISNTKNELWLVSSRGQVLDSFNDSINNNIVRYNIVNNIVNREIHQINEIISFIFDKKKEALLPQSIITFKLLFE